MPALYAWADVLLVHLKPDALSEVSIPSKTYAYMPMGKPILMAVRGDAAAMVEREGIGVIAPPCDPAGLARAVRALRSRSADELDSLGRKAVEVYRTRYSGEVQIARFSALLRAAVPS
jgi:glycosyltransferase involved in cell wall biosynthesis